MRGSNLLIAPMWTTCKGGTSKSNMYDSLTQFVAYVDYIQSRYMCLRDSIWFQILVAKSGAYQA